MDINGDTVLQPADGCGKCFVTEFGPSPVYQSPDQTAQYISTVHCTVYTTVIQKFSTEATLATKAAEEGRLLQTLAQCMKQTINIKVKL